MLAYRVKLAIEHGRLFGGSLLKFPFGCLIVRVQASKASNAAKIRKLKTSPMTVETGKLPNCALRRARPLSIPTGLRTSGSAMVLF